MLDNKYDPRYDDNKKENTIYVTKRFTYPKTSLDENDNKRTDKVRYVSQVISGDTMYGFLKEKDKLTLRTTSGGKQKIVATLYEDPNRVSVLYIARLNTETGNPFSQWQACLYGNQLKSLHNFLSKILSIDYSSEDKFKVSENDLNKLEENTDNLSNIESISMELKETIKNTKEKSDLLELFNQLNLNIDDLYGIKTLKIRKEILLEFKNRLDNSEKFREDKGKDNWQCWFENKKWLFGSEIIQIIDERKTDHNCIYDYLVKNCEGFVDLVEIKNPMLDFWANETDRGNFIPSSDLTKAITQSANYIHNLEKRINDKDTSIRIGNILKPRCTLVMGRSNQWNNEQYGAFRILNSLYHNISIMTYDMLLERANNMFNYKKQEDNNHL